MTSVLLRSSPSRLPAGDPAAAFKILHIITDLSTGGAENMLYRLLAARQRTHLEPAVMSLMSPGSVAAQIEALSVPLLTLDMAQGVPSLSMLPQLVGHMRTVRPDMLQGWMYHGNLAATVAAWMLARRRPVLWNVRHSLHDLAREKPLTRAIIRLGARLSRLPRAIIYNSRVSAEQHEKLGYAADRTVVIPNGFDCERFKPRRGAKAALCRELGIDPGATIIGMIARDHPMKDPVNLIGALGLLARDPARPHVIIAGFGLDRDNQSLQQALQAACIADRVTLLGERADIPEIVAGFDIAVLSSAWGEGFPNVLGEAMASGVPCVATDVGDCAWVIGAAGLVVPPADSTALAGALRRLLELGPEGRRNLGATGRRRALEHFSLGQIVQRYEELYEGIADHGRCRRA